MSRRCIFVRFISILSSNIYLDHPNSIGRIPYKTVYAFDFSLICATWHDHPNNVWLSINIETPHYAVFLTYFSYFHLISDIFPKTWFLNILSLSVESEKSQYFHEAIGKIIIRVMERSYLHIHMFNFRNNSKGLEEI